MRAPFWAKNADIERFVFSKADWVENCINKELSKLKPPAFLSGEEFSFAGTGGYKVKFCDKTRAVFDRIEKTFCLPAVKIGDDERLLDEFKKLVKKEFLKYAKARSAQISAECGLKPRKISVGSARTRWGVCNAENDVTYTLFLAFLPQELIDYVILHELCHVKQKNHSRAFWALLLSFMPDGQNRRKKLHDYSLFLEI